eukprot:TRINITY_DN6352_c1_g1_i1.p1 TRINITY_DN6352_c1_g1~~TRINITY_DN6352_c1_g1_i1.p1  ORF type:complete len:372 (+),score=82.75 TRINITY_DN6352_c1_g1_i1:109-1116(+)
MSSAAGSLLQHLDSLFPESSPSEIATWWRWAREQRRAGRPLRVDTLNAASVASSGADANAVAAEPESDDMSYDALVRSAAAASATANAAGRESPPVPPSPSPSPAPAGVPALELRGAAASVQSSAASLRPPTRPLSARSAGSRWSPLESARSRSASRSNCSSIAEMSRTPAAEQPLVPPPLPAARRPTSAGRGRPRTPRTAYPAGAAVSRSRPASARTSRETQESLAAMTLAYGADPRSRAGSSSGGSLNEGLAPPPSSPASGLAPQPPPLAPRRGPQRPRPHPLAAKGAAVSSPRESAFASTVSRQATPCRAAAATATQQSQAPRPPRPRQQRC